MTTYRSTRTIEAVQYTGQPIPGITCDGSHDNEAIRNKARFAAGCDASRAHLPHVHANVTGGMIVLMATDWIYAVPGGPFAVLHDQDFRAAFEVPAAPAVEPEPESEPAPVPAPVEEPKGGIPVGEPPAKAPRRDGSLVTETPNTPLRTFED